MQYLQEAVGWIKFLGWLSVIGGVLSVFAQFPIGIITGIISVISGMFLISAAKGLDAGDDVEAGDNLRKYFILSGVLAAISIGILLLGIIGVGFLAASR
jgi:hypothetical protein